MAETIEDRLTEIAESTFFFVVYPGREYHDATGYTSDRAIASEIVQLYNWTVVCTVPTHQQLLAQKIEHLKEDIEDSWWVFRDPNGIRACVRDKNDTANLRRSFCQKGLYEGLLEMRKKADDVAKYATMPPAQPVDPNDPSGNPRVSLVVNEFLKSVKDDLPPDVQSD